MLSCEDAFWMTLDAGHWTCRTVDTKHGTRGSGCGTMNALGRGRARQWTWGSGCRAGDAERKKAVRFRDSPWAKNENHSQMTRKMCKTADVDKTFARSAASGSRLVLLKVISDASSSCLRTEDDVGRT